MKTRLAEKGAAFTYDDLVQAVKDGARLRLRPKVMTVATIVATIVASLMPIMWSHRQGAEVMKPLATPVIGGMISSLIHILIVTPVIFLWLRGREVKKGTLHQKSWHYRRRARQNLPRFLTAFLEKIMKLLTSLLAYFLQLNDPAG